MDPANLIILTIFLGVAAMTGFVYQVSNLLGGTKYIVGSPIQIVDNATSDAVEANIIARHTTQGPRAKLNATHGEFTTVENVTVAAPAAVVNAVKAARSKAEIMAGKSFETPRMFDVSNMPVLV